MFVGKRGLLSHIPQDSKIIVDDNPIIPCKTLKNLGIFFDNVTKFDTYINEMNKTIYETLMYINRMRENLYKSTRIAVIHLV